jgi:hypothetical protein
VGLAATAAGAAAVVVVDNPLAVNRAVTDAYNVLSGLWQSVGQALLVDKYIEETGRMPDLLTPQITAAAAAHRTPYGATINLGQEPMGYNEEGVPIYNILRQRQAGIPYFNPNFMELEENNIHPIRDLLANPLRLAAMTTFLGGTHIIYGILTQRYELSLRANESSFLSNRRNVEAKLTRLIDVARQRHADAKARAISEVQRLQARVDEQDRIITEAYTEFVKQRAARVDAYQALMQQWYQARMAAQFAQQAAEAQVNQAQALMALANGIAQLHLPAPPPLIANDPLQQLANVAALPPGLQEELNGGRRRTRRMG